VSTYKFIFSNIFINFRDKRLKYMGNFFDTLPNPSLNPGLAKIAALRIKGSYAPLFDTFFFVPSDFSYSAGA